MTQKYERALSKLQNYEMPSTPYGVIHDGWKNVFEGRRPMTVENIENFLNPELGLSTGIGMQKANRTRDRISLKQLYRLTVYGNADREHFVRSVAPEYIFGEKPIRTCGDLVTTRSVFMNSGTVFEIGLAIDRHLPNTPKLNILEIGSGYGEVCRQIHKYLRVSPSCYDVVDLPNNLMLGEMYLSMVFGSESVDRKLFFGENDFPSEATSPTRIRFYDPSETGLLLDSYDLVINTYSLQEMEKTAAHSYVELIRSKLSPEGIFLSLNSPQKWSIQRYSDYGFEAFENIQTKMPRPIPPSITGTIPILNIFRNTASRTASIEIMDKIGQLQYLGLTSLCERVNGKDLSISLSEGPLYEYLLGRRKSKKPGPIEHLSAVDFLDLVYRILIGDLSKGDFGNDFFSQLRNNDNYKYISPVTLVKLILKLKIKTGYLDLFKILMAFGFDPYSLVVQRGISRESLKNIFRFL